MKSESAGRIVRHDGADFPAPERPPTRVPDEDDDRDDERAGENEAPVGAVDEETEVPEEFSIDDEDRTDRRGPRDAIDDDHSTRR